jgi:hypothetical protein
LKKLLDGVTETTDAISTIEFEMIPFCSLSQNILYNPLTDADGCRCPFQLLEDVKKHTVDVITECMKEPQAIRAKFQEYAYLLTEQVDGLDPLDVQATKEKVDAYMQAGREVQILTASMLRFPLFQLECSGIIESLSECAFGLAETCLNDVAENVNSRATSILDEWQSTHDRILAAPENEEELAELKEFMSKVDKTVKKPLMAQTTEVLQQLTMVESFFHEVDSTAIENSFAAFSWPIQIQLDVMQAEAQLDKEKIQFMEQLALEKDEFWKNMAEWKETLAWVKSVDDFSLALSIEGKVERLHSDLERGRTRVQSYSEREKLFQIEQEDYDELEEIIEEFRPFHHLWYAACEYKHNEEDWMSGPLTSLAAGDIETFIDDQYKTHTRCSRRSMDRQNRRTLLAPSGKRFRRSRKICLSSQLSARKPLSPNTLRNSSRRWSVRLKTTSIRCNGSWIRAFKIISKRSRPSAHVHRNSIA